MPRARAGREMARRWRPRGPDPRGRGGPRRRDLLGAGGREAGRTPGICAEASRRRLHTGGHVPGRGPLHRALREGRGPHGASRGFDLRHRPGRRRQGGPRGHRQPGAHLQDRHRRPSRGGDLARQGLRREGARRKGRLPVRGGRRPQPPAHRGAIRREDRRGIGPQGQHLHLRGRRRPALHRAGELRRRGDRPPGRPGGRILCGDRVLGRGYPPRPVEHAAPRPATRGERGLHGGRAHPRPKPRAGARAKPGRRQVEGQRDGDPERRLPARAFPGAEHSPVVLRRRIPGHARGARRRRLL